MTLSRVFALVIALLCSVSLAMAGPRIQVQGLFKGSGVFLIDGQQVMLREGQAHASGVRLVTANSRYAEVEVDGEVRRLGMTSNVHSNFGVAEKRRVLISRDSYGQYSVNGSINGQPMKFLVDTGASVITLNANQARRLGIDFIYKGEPGVVVTASGKVTGYTLPLSSVKVGELEIRNVRAVVIDGAFPETALLGMTFLGQVSMSENNGVLELQAKY